ncbi:MAG: pentapeptide repeat-containing protein, partial [Leptolyngbyaceae cyanobacterium SL_5_14]|nr:pentapeptide repeat-containing protein [Leptolyngbyaceae cyanobacterium SL_5_14]
PTRRCHGTLQKRANQVYNSFSPEQQATAQHIFLSLTQLGEGTEDTRRRVLKQDLISTRFPESLIDVVVQRLADEKLIVTDEQGEKRGGDRQAVIDVAHEALIRHWLLLRKWLTENRDQLRQKRKIEERAEEWRLHHKSKDYLLQGKLLVDAKAFHKQQTNALSLSGLAVEFIQKSTRQKRVNQLRAAGFLTVPVLVVYVAIVPPLRQINYGRAWRTIETRSPGTLEALEVLTEGCREKYALNISDYLLTLLFGDCADLSSANLHSTNLRSADLSSANLDSADLSSANLDSADLSSANLDSANLDSANLRDANLRNANLHNANLRSANLRYADFRSTTPTFSGQEVYLIFPITRDSAAYDTIGASLSGANFSDADLSGADFRDVRGLIPEQVKAARNWENATYSDEFRKQLGIEE